MMQRLPPSLAKYIYSLWSSELILTYFHVDNQGLLVDWVGHPRHYGLPTPEKGQPITTQISFLEGILPIEHTQVLEFIGVGSGRVAHVHLIPFEQGTWVLMFDATAEHDRQQQMQQQYNELSVQSYRQTQLLQNLETARQQLETEKHHLEKTTQEKSQLIAGLSHELRTPLTSIVGYTGLLEGAQEIENKENEYLGTVKRNASYLLNLIDNVLEQARSESQHVSIHPINCQIKKLLEDIKHLFLPMAQERTLVFQLDYAADLPEQILLDEIRFRQILINLITNALKFTTQGSVSLHVHWQTNRLYFSVEDTGLGISEEGKAKIFQAFHREKEATHVQGVGLGLSISRHLVELMDGKLQLESELNKGSRFFADVQAPATQSMPQPMETAAQLPQSLGDYTVLLAEDSLGIRTLLELYLQEGGYKTLLAEDGAQAVKMALQYQPDAVLMDLQMPVLDGFAATQELRQHNFNAPIVALSASTLAQDRKEAMQAGCDLYLMKPLDADYLLSNLQDILNPNPNAH